MKASEDQSSNSSYIPNEKDILRVSKSSFMTYKMCPRQFYWRYVADIPSPPRSEEMIRGVAIHNVMERGLLDGSDVLMEAAEQEGVAGDDGVDSLNILLHQIAHDMGGFEVVEAEVKHEVYEIINGQPVIWVGLIDGVLKHPDTGKLILVELKTGKMNMGKLGRTRKELVYYTRLLRGLDYEDVSHFLYITPDYEYDAEDKLLLEGNKRGKTMWIGAEKGFALLEPFRERSYTIFEEALYDTVESLTSQEWQMNWNDYFCPMWCDFSLDCEAELSGIKEWNGNGII
tara:strand:- start:331 stop:1188 length:858 start_codon:yes stop_codon:yes gene_type:complete